MQLEVVELLELLDFPTHSLVFFGAVSVGDGEVRCGQFEPLFIFIWSN